MQSLSSARRAAPFSGARTSAAAPRPCLGLSLSKRASMQQQQRAAVTDASLADIADLENRSTGEEADSVGGLPVLPSDQVKLRVRMRGYDIRILRDASDQIVQIGQLTGAKVSGPVNLPTKKKVYCVLRSPHVNKDAREHFEVRTHHRLIDLSNLSAQTVEALMEWRPASSERRLQARGGGGGGGGGGGCDGSRKWRQGLGAAAAQQEQQRRRRGAVHAAPVDQSAAAGGMT
ncbi:30S ribosomal protein S10 [Monoraphidium neglectum]|uniref:30S ribosomal protein S10 n=1 Tax=Monoraphidium neglectum TaxID=145388 RepID=A0A0D2KPT9_9CHLO|nr:30S ribosomal protein S10 [Monoraphidium neglectum]KIY97608.1 30S ribosomal protein S10 [Monoraphidium neglectum]|eukprot:XP_013896628.1 30S ribosomal protein S10 [Monoraphidium neglectum]